MCENSGKDLHIVTFTIKIAKDEFYAQKVQECEGDQKKLNKVIDCLMGREKPKTLPIASSNLLLAETFNNFFI